MYLLANKANLVSRDSQVVVDVKKVLLENLLEAIKLAQTKGYPGQDLLVCKTEIINLYRVLKRYEKAFETADEVIKESKSLGLNETEGNGYAKRIDIRWDLKQYKEGIADVYLAEEAYRVAKHYAGLILLCEETAERLGELPLLQRYKFRQERARFEAKAKEYRQQAKEAGQEVPEAKP
jgi:hypothetical protein